MPSILIASGNKKLNKAGASLINQLGELAYDVKQTAQILFSKSEEDVDTFAKRGFPSYMTKANPDTWARTNAQAMLGSFDPRTLPKTMPDIKGFRADPIGRYGGKEGIETLPTVFSSVANSPYAQGSPDEIYSFVRTLARAKKYGVPQLNAEQLTALLLKEGKSTFGTLSFDTNDKVGGEIYRKLKDEGLSPAAAGFAVLVKQKKEVAARLGITFEEAWNGTGRSWAGKTGKDYAEDFPHHIKAARHPKNKQLVQFIQSALDAERK